VSRPLWTAAEIGAATGGRPVGVWSVVGVAIDSREVQPGELFIALRGPNHDGHDFAAAALKRGAALLVDHRPEGVPESAPMVLVADTMAALTALGVAGRARSRAKTAAITGSVGKTGTKEALRLALSVQGPTHASAASHNNHWGVPLSLARQPEDAAFAVYELGMNQPGEIDRLVRLVRPHVAVITAIEAAHLGFFPSLDAIADAKAEIFAGLEPGGSAVLPADSPHFERLAGRARAAGCQRILGFGTAAGAEARLLDLHLDEEGSAITMSLAGRELAFRIGAPGRHWASNALAVVAAAFALGADPERAAGALAAFCAPKGRGARHRILWQDGELTLIDESYNANPASVRAALGLLAAASGRKVAVLGDMLELGAEGPRLHAELAAAVDDARVDLVLTAGALMRHLHDALPVARRGAHVETADALGPVLAAVLRPGDTVLVKGSLGSRMGPVVDALLEADRPGRDGGEGPG
jgi:UDP-N-acetylmuramoyl-tripeptide--D-alanyl-D-alanine ligase